MIVKRKEIEGLKHWYDKVTREWYYLMTVPEAPKPILIDKKFARKVAGVHWTWNKRNNRARGVISPGVRMYLHKYIVFLNGQRFPETWFSNGDAFDYRLCNLNPFRRDMEGSLRKPNARKKAPKGVSLHKKSKKWQATIRVAGKLKHLGLYDDVAGAVEAYDSAAKEMRPELAHLGGKTGRWQ